MKNYLTLFLLLLNYSLYAQKMPFKFGDLDRDLIEMSVYPLDSGADAVVLSDFGNAYFFYDSKNGFFFNFERTTRIKIFNSDGYKYANVEVPVYNNASGDRESLSKVKGITYNLDKGKIVKSKMEKNAMFTEEYDQNWSIEKFTLPDVKEGSVIEYQYTIRSPFWSNL